MYILTFYCNEYIMTQVMVPSKTKLNSLKEMQMISYKWLKLPYYADMLIIMGFQKKDCLQKSPKREKGTLPFAGSGSETTDGIFKHDVICATF